MGSPFVHRIGKRIPSAKYQAELIMAIQIYQITNLPPISITGVRFLS
jgi:hypothetical protein